MKKPNPSIIQYDDMFKDEIQKAIKRAKTDNTNNKHIKFEPKEFNYAHKPIEQMVFSPRSGPCEDHDALAPVNVEFRVYFEDENVGRYNIKSQTQRTFCFDYDCVHKYLDLISSINPILKQLLEKNEKELKKQFDAFVRRSSCSTWVKQKKNRFFLREGKRHAILDIGFYAPSSRCTICKKSNTYWRGLKKDKVNSWRSDYSRAFCGPDCHNLYINKRIAKTLAGDPDED